MPALDFWSVTLCQFVELKIVRKHFVNLLQVLELFRLQIHSVMTQEPCKTKSKNPEMFKEIE